MKRKTLFVILAAIFASSLAMLGITPVQAAPGHHEQVVIPSDTQYTWYGSENPCGYDLVFNETGNVKINYWYDEDGNLSKVLEISGNVKKTLSAHDKTVDFHIQGPVSYEFELQNDVGIYTYKARGTSALVTVPGEGIIYGGAGLIVEVSTFDLNNGDWSYSLDKYTGNLSIDDFAGICAYLGE